MEAQAQTGHFRRQEETKKRQKFGGESRDFIGILIIIMEMKKDKTDVHVQQREVAKKMLIVSCM